jgi:hypothetical protein
MKTRSTSLAARVAGSALITLLGLFAQPALAQTFCVYDPMGTAGDLYSLFKDYQLEAKRWRVNIDLVAYTDDNKLTADFDAGHCDMANMIGMRARSYNQFTGTIDSPSTIENYVEMRDLLALLASPKLDKYMVSGPYEVVGVLPVGAGYAVVDDRNINGVAKTVGRKAAVPKWDKAQTLVTAGIKAVAVPLDLPAYGTKFASGEVDIIVIPLVLYKPLEIDKSLAKSGGGVIRRPLFQFSMQLIAKRDQFPAGYGGESRAYIGHQADHALSIVRNVENQVDSRFWIYAQHSEVAVWNTTMRAVCDKMVKEGYLDKRMLGLLRRIRCKSTPDEPECQSINEQMLKQETQKTQ